MAANYLENLLDHIWPQNTTTKRSFTIISSICIFHVYDFRTHKNQSKTVQEWQFFLFKCWNNLLGQDDSTHITHNVILGKNLRKWRKWFLWLMMRSSLFLSFVPNPPQSVHHIINNLEQRQKNESSKLFLVRLNRSMFNCSIHENKSKFADLSRCCVEFYMIKIYGAWKHNSTFSSKLAKYLLECKMHHRLN